MLNHRQSSYAQYITHHNSILYGNILLGRKEEKKALEFILILGFISENFVGSMKNILFNQYRAALDLTLAVGHLELHLSALLMTNSL